MRRQKNAALRLQKILAQKNIGGRDGFRVDKT